MNFPRFFGLFLLGPVLALGLSCSPRLAEIPGPKTQPNIVFVSTRRGTTEIFTMNADGSNPKQLTDTRGFESSPAWSPDRSQILFTRYEEISGLTELLVMEPDGSKPRILHKGEKIYPTPSGHPTGLR